MARARNLKPGFFKNEDLAECSPWARLCFAGLWLLADREGRLEDRPKRIKGELFPFDTVDVDPLLGELARRRFIIRYANGDGSFIQVSRFSEHQAPHYSEKASTIKPPGLQESDAHQAENFPDNTENPQPIKRGSQPPDILNPSSPNPSSPNPERAPTCAAAVARAREGKNPENPPNGHATTPAGTVCRAMRSAGLTATNPGDPRLLALLAQGATEAEFVGIAAEAVGKGRGWAWVLKVVEMRRSDAAAITLADPVDDGSAAAHEAFEREAHRQREEEEHRIAAMSPESHAARKRVMAMVGGLSAKLTGKAE